MTFSTVAQGLAVASAVERSLMELESALRPMLQKNPALSPAKMAQVLAKLRARSAATVVRIGDDVFTGIVRQAIGSARANITVAKRMLSSPAASMRLAVISRLLDTAKGATRGIQTMVNATQTLEGWMRANPTRSASSLVSINGIGALGIEPLTLAAAAALVVGVVIFVVGVSVLIDTLQKAQNAEIALRAADAACANANPPCTPEQYEEVRQEAAEHQAQVAPTLLDRFLPEPGNDPISRASDAVFWGGIMLTAALIGYGIWTTLPAARHAREGLERRSRESFAGTRMRRY